MTPRNGKRRREGILFRESSEACPPKATSKPLLSRRRRRRNVCDYSRTSTPPPPPGDLQSRSSPASGRTKGPFSRWAMGLETRFENEQMVGCEDTNLDSLPDSCLGEWRGDMIVTRKDGV